MRIARKLALLLAMAIAATAFAASNASAIEPVTIAEEDGNLCTTPCTIHVVGESSLRAFHAFVISSCIDEFHGDINANGTGEITQWTGVTGHIQSPGCTREMCTDPDPAGDPEHWPIEGTEEVDENEALMFVEFCLTPIASHGSPESRCEVPVDVTETDNTHDYSFAVFHECDIGGTPVEVEGNWTTEAVHEPLEEDEVEIVHAP